MNTTCIQLEMRGDAGIKVKLIADENGLCAYVTHNGVIMNLVGTPEIQTASGVEKVWPHSLSCRISAREILDRPLTATPFMSALRDMAYRSVGWIA